MPFDFGFQGGASVICTTCRRGGRLEPLENIRWFGRKFTDHFTCRGTMRFYYKLQLFVTLIWLLSACSQQPDLHPSGTAVAWGNLDPLITRSISQKDIRQNEIELRISLSKNQFQIRENIEIEAVLQNKTDKTIIVRRMDAMPIFGGDVTNVHGIVFLVVTQETNVILEKGGLLFNGFVQESFPPPTAFAVMPAKDSFMHIFSMLDIFGEIPPGNYSIQMKYTNDYFGAVDETNSEDYFIDYDAWIGEISSNIGFFQIIP